MTEKRRESESAPFISNRIVSCARNFHFLLTRYCQLAPDWLLVLIGLSNQKLSRMTRYFYDYRELVYKLTLWKKLFWLI